MGGPQKGRKAFNAAIDTRLRAYVQGLGGVRKAAAKAGLPAATVTSWLRGSGSSVPSAFALKRLADVANESLDYLVGRDVPEKVGVSRSTQALGDDLRAYLIEGLVAREVPREVAEEYLYPPPKLLDDILFRAHEYAFRSSVKDEMERVSMERVRARWAQEARQAEKEEAEEVERLVQEEAKAKTPPPPGRRRS